MLPQRYLFFSIVVPLNQKKCRFYSVSPNKLTLITKKKARFSMRTYAFCCGAGGSRTPVQTVCLKVFYTLIHCLILLLQCGGWQPNHSPSSGLISPCGRNTPRAIFSLMILREPRPQEAGGCGGVLVSAPALGAEIKPINSVN